MSNLTNFGLSILATIMLGSCFSEPVPQESIVMESSSQRKREPTLAEKCRPLMAEPLESAWNPTTDTYTIPEDWAECMGVGKVRKDMYRDEL